MFTQQIDWPELFSRRTVADALGSVGRALRHSIAELTLESTTPAGVPLAGWRATRFADSPGSPEEGLVGGEPPWRLRVVPKTNSMAGAALPRAISALEMWRFARGQLGQVESRLSAKARELGLIQEFGRRAAESRTPFQLFRETVEILQRAEGLDAALVAHALDDGREAIAFLGRPIAAGCLAELTRRAGEVLGWGSKGVPVARALPLEGFDEGRGRREEVRPAELVLLPLLRRDRVAASLLAVPASRARQSQLRLLFSASNQICIHLDRILTVREAEASRFRAILDSMPQAVLLADPRMQVKQSNRSARCTLPGLGIPAEGDLSPTMRTLGILDEIDRVRRGEARFVEIEASPDGDRRFSITATPLREEGVGAHDLVLVFADVTEQRRLQRMLAQSEKMSSLGQMISGVAHELNNPLTSILGYTQLLRNRTRDERSLQKLETLQNEARRCERIVRNLLSFARRREPRSEPVSLNEVVKGVLSLMGYQLRVDGIDVESQLDPELPVLQGDAHQLQQLLVNLVTNSRQAIRQQSPHGRIRLRTRAEPGVGLLLEIGDSGPGVPDAIRGKVFDPFFTTKDEGKGTGLGLSLVYGIVSAHRGTIEILQDEQGGALFRITFPAGVAVDPRRSAASDEDPPPDLRPGRILVVEDEEPLRRMLSDILAEDGHRAVTAGSGEEALQHLCRSEFDLIISDIKMPGMSGRRLYEEIRREDPGIGDRLLLTTGDTLGAESQEFVAGTGLEVLRKPFDVEALRRVVRRRLAGTRAS